MPVIFAGSAEMFGNAATAPQDENTPMCPRNVFGISKLAAWHLMRVYREQHGLFACCGILYNHDSPRRQPHFVTRKITQAIARIRAGEQKELLLATWTPFGTGDMPAIMCARCGSCCRPIRLLITSWPQARGTASAIFCRLHSRLPVSSGRTMFAAYQSSGVPPNLYR